MQATQHKVEAAEGERADFPRLGNRFVLSGERTDGRFALVEPDFQALAEIQARYGLTMDVASIEPLMKEHGLEA